MKKIYIGIDDTDNKESRGTGYQGRVLSMHLFNRGMIKPISISRHQLLVDSRIPYTSHNSSCCIFCESNTDISIIFNEAKKFLITICADGSDCGLCIASDDMLNDDIATFGLNTKKEIMTTDKAYLLAQKYNIFLEGLTGQKIGVIGALAAVGLRYYGNDGRVLWLPNLRELEGVFIASELKKMTGIETIRTIDGKNVSKNHYIEVGEWCRPIIENKKITLLVEKAKNNQYEYKSASKEYIKSITE